MQSLWVPHREVPVRVRLGEGGEVTGTMFVAEAGPDGGAGSLAGRLNDATESFVPFRREDGTRELLHKRWITWVETRAEERSAEAPGSAHRVVLHLADGGRIDGHLHYFMRPERGRFLDYLNAAPEFIPVRDSRGARLLVHRRFVVRAEDHSTE